MKAISLCTSDRSPTLVFHVDLPKRIGSMTLNVLGSAQPERLMVACKVASFKCFTWNNPLTRRDNLKH